MQAEIEDRLGLLGGQPGGASTGDPVARIVDQRDQLGRGVGRPFALHQLLARLVGVLRAADQLDHFVDVGDGDGEADQHMGAVARLVEQEFGAA